MVVYQYVCRCDCRYVDRTSQRLYDRINQHISRCIRSNKRPTKNMPNQECKITSTPSVSCDSAIGQHFLENEECAKKTKKKRCTIFHFRYSKIFVLFIKSGSKLHQFLSAYSLPSKRIRLFTPNFALKFFCAHFRLKRNNIFPPIKLPKWPILTNRSTTRRFLYFCITLYNFTWFLQHFTS